MPPKYIKACDFTYCFTKFATYGKTYATTDYRTENAFHAVVRRRDDGLMTLYDSALIQGFIESTCCNVEIPIESVTVTKSDDGLRFDISIDY